jgi:uncharacterized protein (TIGR03067 family)
MIGKLLLLAQVGFLVFTPLKNYQLEDDWKKIEGTWIPVTAELNGQKMSEAFLKDTKLVLTGGHYTNQNDHGDYKLISAEKPEAPKAMDVIGTDGPNKGKTFLAIYELSGDTLRICYDLAGKTRPSEFATKAGTRQFLVSYKREKS